MSYENEFKVKVNQKAFKNYLEFESNKWIKKKDTKEINHEENNFVKILKLFVNSNKVSWAHSSAG